MNSPSTTSSQSMPSLRARLVLGTTLALAVILAAAGCTLYVLMRESLVREFDEALAADARAITGMTEQDAGQIEVEQDPGKLPALGPRGQPIYFEMWNDAGASVAKSQSLGDAHLSRPGVSDLERPKFDGMSLPNGTPGRAMSLKFQPHDDSDTNASPLLSITLLVARDTVHLDKALTRLRLLLLGVLAAAVVAGSGVVAWVIGRGLRPLDTLAGAIQRVGVNDLSERINPGQIGTPREVAPVVQRLNELLARLESAMTRERAFTADVAHELRTPLAGLTTMMEVATSKNRDADAYRDVIRKCLHVTGGMRSMVDNLLLLARADCDQITPAAVAVEIAPLVQECWELHEPEAARRGLKVQMDLDAATIAHADRCLLRMIVNNLLANAACYADENGQVSIRTRPEPGRCALTVSNAAGKITPADVAQVFDRFWRGDAARTDAGVRCGLGLSLCKKLTEVVRGTIEATLKDGTFTVTLVVPSEPGR